MVWTALAKYKLFFLFLIEISYKYYIVYVLMQAPTFLGILEASVSFTPDPNVTVDFRHYFDYVGRGLCYTGRHAESCVHRAEANDWVN